MPMSLSRRQFVSLAASAAAYGAAAADPVAPWRNGVKIQPVTTLANRHSIHTYFNVTPESPDGRYVLYYTSSTPEGHAGEIRIQERATGSETVLVRNLDCEDAHRVACQQWVSHGRTVLFHDMRNGEAVCAAVDIGTGMERVLAKGRMVSWGQPDSDWAPIYGVHFQPGKYKDLEMLNVETGRIRTLVTGKQVRERFLEPIRQMYGEKEISTPFATLSPDGKRIFFKLSAASDGYVPLPEGHLRWPRSYQSNREGLVCYDIERSKLLFFRHDWGHPAWHPSSKKFINMPNVMIDAETGVETPIPGLPKFPGQHLSVSPDGNLFVTDTQFTPFGGGKGEWGVAVCDTRGGSWTIIAKFQGDEGATTWRKNHPHPVFSADSKRIYYNVNSGKYTQLFVAERGRSVEVSGGE